MTCSLPASAGARSRLKPAFGFRHHDAGIGGGQRRRLVAHQIAEFGGIDQMHRARRPIGESAPFLGIRIHKIHQHARSWRGAAGDILGQRRGENIDQIGLHIAQYAVDPARQPAVPETRHAHRPSRDRAQRHLRPYAETARRAEIGVGVARAGHGQVLKIVRIVGAGAQPDLMPRRGCSRI